MALFGGRRDNNRPTPSREGAAPNPPPGIRPLPAREVTCGVCDARRTFSRCWERTAPVAVCPGCRGRFDNPAALYRLPQPACPRCGEFLEHPGFQYGLCDTCGSKYEIVPGTKPGLLPNKAQRDEMNKVGRIRNR